MAKIEEGTANVVRVIYPVQENPKPISTILVGDPETGMVSCTTAGNIKTLYTGSIAENNDGFVTGGNVSTALNAKVDKVEGKGLSSNDYTNADKEKLAGVEIGANAYTLPVATTETLGGIKVGENLTVSGDGILNAIDKGSDRVVIDLTDRHGLDGNEKVRVAVQAALPALMASKSKACTLLLSKDNGLHCPYTVVGDTYLHMAVAYNSEVYEPQNPPYTTFSLWVLEAFIKDGVVERATFSANSQQLTTWSGLHETLGSYVPIVYENTYEQRVPGCYWRDENGDNIQVYQRTFIGTATGIASLAEGTSRAFLVSGTVKGFPSGYQVAGDNAHLWNYAVVDNKLYLSLYDETASQLIGGTYYLTFRYTKA